MIRGYLFPFTKVVNQKDDISESRHDLVNSNILLPWHMTRIWYVRNYGFVIRECTVKEQSDMK